MYKRQLYALVPKGSAKQGAKCLGRTGDMVKTFSEKFGVAYPYEKYAQAVVADFIFGGMENTTATTLTEYALYDDRAALDYDADDLVAHELGHQWWGDLLTCRDWSHAWLNEGFATFCEEVYREHRLGKDEARQHVLAAAKRYMAEDAGEYRRPIVSRDYEEPIDVFDRHLYEKGGWVLHMLRRVVGEETFFTAVREYRRRHERGNATRDDLRAVFEELSGRDLKQFFDQWVETPYRPVLRASWRNVAGGKVEVTVRQTQGHTVVHPDTAAGDAPTYRFPLLLRAVSYTHLTLPTKRIV